MTDLDAIKARIPKYGGGDMKALVAEIERLRAENSDLRMLRDEHLMDTEHAFQEGADEERAAVVAHLRETVASDKETAKQYAHAEALAYWRGVISVLEGAAEAIERGEHRREEES